MGNRRIYLGREVSKYAVIAGGAIITITSLFFVLMALGFTITGTDDFCLGTPENPCVSYGKICNTGPNNYDIYNPEEIEIDFSPTIENYWIFFKDGRVKKEFLIPQGVAHSTAGWRYENFTNATKPRSDRIYVHRFARYSCQDYMLVGLKENPDDVIKWGVGVGKEYLDPFWYGENESAATTSVSGNISLELGSKINITTNLTGAATTCVDIDHPDYGDNYTCGTPNAQFIFNISYFNKNTFADGVATKLLDYFNGNYYTANSENNNSFNISFNGLNDIESVALSLNGSKANTFQEDYDVVSRSGTASNPANAYDGNWSTYSTTQSPGGGTAKSEILLENYTIPSGVTAANITTRRYNYNVVGSNMGNQYAVSCYNYTASDWYAFYVHNQGQGTYSGEVKESSIPSVCMNETLQIRILTYSRFTGGGSSYIFAYEDSIEWMNSTYPSGVKIYVNGSLDRQFDAVINGSFAHTVDLNDTITDGNITFYEPGIQLKYLKLDTVTDVINATIDFIGHLYRGARTDQWSFEKDTWGIDANVSAGMFWLMEQTSDDDQTLQSYNYTTRQPISPSQSWGRNLYTGSDPYQIRDMGGFFAYNSGVNYCFLQREYVFYGNGTLWNTAESINCDGTEVILSYDNPLQLGDMGQINSTYGMYVLLRGGSTFNIFEIANISNEQEITISGSPGSDNIYGIDVGETTSSIWVIRRHSSTKYYISQYNINGTYEGYEFLLLNTDEQQAKALSYSGGFFHVLNSDNTVSIYTNSSSYPKNLKIDVGIDGDYEYEADNITINATEIEVDLNTTEINNYKDSSYCTDVTCVIPISFSSTQGGILNYNDIYVIQNLTSLIFNATVFDNVLSGTNNEENISVSISAINGNIEVDNLDFDYLGGNSTVEIFAWEAGNKSNNDTFNIFNYFSNWNYSLPSYIDYLEFIPKSSTAKNVTPYGQSSSRPILNITSSGFGGKASNFSVYLNETYSCVNLTMSTTDNKSAGFLLNATWRDYFTNFSYGESQGLWMWADYGCNYTTWKLWEPDIHFRNCCEDCICSEDIA